MPSRLPKYSSAWIGFLVLLVAVAAAWGFRDRWVPQVQDYFRGRTPAAGDAAAGHEEHGHDHDSEHGHDDSSALELSPQARKNIGLRTGEVALEDYERAITIPAIVAERPGRTHIEIAAPMTGVVTAVYAIAGEAVRSETLLFRLRLTHEDLVATQTQFVQTIGQLDVERKEIERLERVTSSGAVAGKVLLERKYERDKLEATASAQREALLLHGLSEAQVNQIAETRKLIREITIEAPLLHDDASLHHEAEASHGSSAKKDSGAATVEDDHHASSERFVVTGLNVSVGKAVEAGELLCTLADFSDLYLEVLAFERDAEELVRAANTNQTVTAVIENGRSEADVLRGLEIAYVSNEVQADSRTLHVYVRLPNTIVREEMSGDRQFLTWRFKPGQRMQVRVPVEQWKNVIILPVEAVAREGLETFVFVENGSHFDRRPVHVTYRDQRHAAISNDGSLFPGETVALNSAHQLQMAIKNKSGGGVDPHAGHNH